MSGVRSGGSVIGYVRAGGSVSVAEQQAVITAACERRGWELLRVEADSANKGSTGRAALADALTALRAGQAQALVVARLDRPARSLSEAAHLIERARGEGWNLVALDLGLDLSTRAGKRIATAFTIAAEWERRLRSERTREALARRRAEGKRLGTPRRAPAETLAKIRRLRAQGKSLQAIAEELNRLRIPTARGGSQWRPSSVASVLSRVP
jgi:DNA invertase Pin-like site-specific DNA recombinase